MNERESIKKFLARVEAAALRRMRENMKRFPYKTVYEYYPEAIVEVLREEAHDIGDNGGLENTEECLSGLQGSA